MRLWIALGLLLLLPWTLLSALALLAMRQGSRLVTDIGRWAGYPPVETQVLATAIGEAGPAGQLLVAGIWLAGVALVVVAGMALGARR